ncbi:MAG: 2-isopropylmalate synthase [Candidatus Altiarchaeales archaeon]|nr:2-isopropylmalate synthase [Candidatus Altiarchaeales archaeon]
MNQFTYNKKTTPKTPRKIMVFDTTLRDGEQTPGVNLTVEDKKQIAQALSNLGVKYIEAGFPVSSEGEREAVKQIKDMGIKPEVVGLARCVEKDLDAAVDSGCDMVHVFIGTSPIHRKHKLKMTKKQVLESAQKSIQHVLDRGVPVHFSPEDACRTEEDYLTRVCEMAYQSGAKHINIPDTVGVMTPAAMSWLINKLADEVPAEYAVHCHNDFGMAQANTLAAITSGATIPHVTVNGLGERAGNADLEQVAVAAQLIYGIKTGIKNKRIWETSRLVERITQVKVMPNYPIVGSNAFAHESGVHVHGVLAKASTYEPIKPEYVGTQRKIVLGKLGGRAGVADKLRQMKVKATNKQVEQITQKVKSLADKGKRVTEEDLIAIAEDMIGEVKDKDKSVELVDLSLYTQYGKPPIAHVELKVAGETRRSKQEGVGPVDATLKAIKEAVGDEKIQLEEYHLDAITGGSDALADVSIKVSRNGSTTLANAVHEDVVMASINAYLNGVNRIIKK